jgi:steroid 5-alpha reductase family enzyme
MEKICGTTSRMTADPLALVLVGYGAMVLFMAALWAIQLLIRNASIADVGFCIGLMAVVLWYAGQASGETERKLLVMLMVCLYAGRLGVFLLFNRVIGKPEDARYQELRRSWGASEHWMMFGYFQLQAAAVTAFSLPFLVVIQNPRPPFGLVELAGALIWAGAVTGEAVADWQLSRFRARPWNRDRVCREGLWYASRHPNYFFEWLHWWSYVVMAVGAPGWPLTLIGPAGMGWALLNVTGIPWTERQALKTRGEEYREYQQTTNALVPWWPKRPFSRR